MQFFYDGTMYKAVRITGPKHNMLGLLFSDNKNLSTIKINDLETNKNLKKIYPHEVESQVMTALSQANIQFNKKYIIKEIEFISSDTPSSNAYKLLAKGIIERLIFKKKFKQI